MNGREKLYYCENESGHVYITDECAPTPSGFIKHMTTTPSTMDLIYRRLNQQEHENHQALIDRLYQENAPRMAQMRARLRQRRQESTCDAFEKAVIDSALACIEAKEEKMRENTVYGVSAMQTTEANPKAPGDNRVIFDAPKGMVN